MPGRLTFSRSQNFIFFYALEMRSYIPVLALLGVVSANPTPNQCKSFPGDKSWPSQAEWNSLNKTVGGRLVATVPLGAPCHVPTFDDATCESLKKDWQFEKIQYVPNMCFEDVTLTFSQL